MEKPRDQRDREEVRDLSDKQLSDELLKPTGNWREDIIRETLKRILDRDKPKGSDFEKILYMQSGKVNLKGATWSSQFEEKIKQYKFKKEDLIVLHISIPEDNIVRFINIEPITQRGIQQIIKDADNKKEGKFFSSQP
jgi:hypothetical protein